MSESIAEIEQTNCFQFRASFSPCTIMQVTRYDLNHLERQLAATISKAPNFFIGSGVVIDLESVKFVRDIDFVRMRQIIIANNMVPVGVRGGSDEQHAAAVSIGIPLISVGRGSVKPVEAVEPAVVETPVVEAPAETKDIEQLVSARQRTKIVTTPIRSGMQVYAKDADLIVIAPVSVGAELMADGNIHVYGPLRGRALAGVQGDINARIFCRTLEAELVAIAGYYLVKEELQNMASSDSGVQVYLDNEQVKVESV
jgi:septum site-determining protein MinC